MKKIQKILLATLPAAMAVSLYGCGGGNSDGDNPNTANLQMSGSVVDDYIAFSRVYLDLNNNGEFDFSTEPYAFTDQDGYFSIAKDGTDYCANDRVFEYKYCLEIPPSFAQDSVIRAVGGRNLQTTEEYNGSMSLLTDGEKSALTVTGLSSLQQAFDAVKEGLDATEGAQIETLLEGLSPNTTDPFADETENDIFKIAFGLNKISELIAEDLKQNLGSDEELQVYINDIYKALIPLLDFNSDSTALASSIKNLDLTGLYQALDSTGPSADVQTIFDGIVNLLDDNTTVTDKRQRAFGAELMTKGGIQKVKGLTNEMATNIVNKSKSAVTKTDQDFTLIAEDVVDPNTQQLNDYSTSPFPLETLKTKAMRFTSDSDDTEYEITFEGDVNNFVEGDLYFCEKDLDEDAELLKGKWKQSDSQNYIIYVDYLSTSITLKSLDVDNNTACTQGDELCIATSYPEDGVTVNEVDSVSDPYIDKSARSLCTYSD